MVGDNVRDGGGIGAGKRCGRHRDTSQNLSIGLSSMDFIHCRDIWAWRGFQNQFLKGSMGTAEVMVDGWLGHLNSNIKESQQTSYSIASYAETFRMSLTKRR
jgi:hypothetical protein